MLDSRASVLEEARAELRTRAERAESELDQVRAELAELRRQRSARPGAGIDRPSRDARAFTRSRSRGLTVRPSAAGPTRRRFGVVRPRHFRLNQAC